MEYKTFDSSTRAELLEIVAPYYNAILPTTVTFVQEQITLFVDSLGHVEFFDGAERSLGKVELPVHKDPSEYGHTAQYGNVKCTADGGSITIFLPVYYWSDSYPHCDGESDRWDRHVERWFRVVFDCTSHTVSILDRG